MLVTLTRPNSSALAIDFDALLKESPKTLLYFYPRDNTPGCTLEGQDFTRLTPEFAALGIAVIGVSKDDHDSHLHFQSSCGIGIPLIADDGGLCDKFAVMGSKNMYGKMVFGLLRSTFLLDQSGVVIQEWRSVRATGHAEKILAELTKSAK
jgi:thioredoxin-dependent peroxiredoxin